MASRLPEQMLVHFYRAVVGHMQDWAAVPAPLARLWSRRPGRRGGRGNPEV